MKRLHFNNQQKINWNNKMLGKALSAFDECRFKNGSKLSKIHHIINRMYNSQKVLKHQTDFNDDHWDVYGN